MAIADAESEEQALGNERTNPAHYLAAWVRADFLDSPAATFGSVSSCLVPSASRFRCAAAVRSQRQRTQRMATV